MCCVFYSESCKAKVKFVALRGKFDRAEGRKYTFTLQPAAIYLFRRGDCFKIRVENFAFEGVKSGVKFARSGGGDHPECGSGVDAIGIFGRTCSGGIGMLFTL